MYHQLVQTCERLTALITSICYDFLSGCCGATLSRLAAGDAHFLSPPFYSCHFTAPSCACYCWGCMCKRSRFHYMRYNVCKPTGSRTNRFKYIRLTYEQAALFISVHRYIYSLWCAHTYVRGRESQKVTSVESIIALFCNASKRIEHTLTSSDLLTMNLLTGRGIMFL